MEPEAAITRIYVRTFNMHNTDTSVNSEAVADLRLMFRKIGTIVHHNSLCGSGEPSAVISFITTFLIFAPVLRYELGFETCVYTLEFNRTHLINIFYSFPGLSKPSLVNTW